MFTPALKVIIHCTKVGMEVMFFRLNCSTGIASLNSFFRVKTVFDSSRLFANIAIVVYCIDHVFWSGVFATSLRICAGSNVDS